MSDDIPDEHRTAIKGWKSKSDQLHKQQKSVMEVNEAAERINLLSISKQKGEK